MPIIIVLLCLFYGVSLHTTVAILIACVVLIAISSGPGD